MARSRPGLAELARATEGTSRERSRPLARKPDALRGTAESGTLPTDRASPRQPPERFAWAAQLGATGYRLGLFQADGSLVWRSAPVPDPEPRPAA